MIKLEYNDGKLYITCSGNDFIEQIESCKYLHMTYISSLKKWSISAGKYKEVEDEFKPYGIEFSEYDKNKLKDYMNNLSTFSKLTKRSEYRHFNSENLLFPPKYNWQVLDIQKAINQTSMLFKWSTGTGKSYALSGIFETLRRLKIVKKGIILTSSIGIMNLAFELKKFMPSFDNKRCLIIPSVTILKDRAIFDNDDYDIIIMGYDTFKSINDFYDKIKNNRTKKIKYKKSALPLDKWYGNYAGIIFMDECHLLGTHGSHRAEVIEMNLKFWKYRYLFSATPADKEEKFYITLKVLDNALVNGLSYNDWLSTYCELGTKFSRYAPNKSTWNEGKWKILMNKVSSTYIVTRDKSLLNLPSAIDIPLIEIDMSDKQRKIYEQFSYINLDIIKSNSNNKENLVERLINTFQILQMSIDNPSAILSSKSMDKIRALCDASKVLELEKSLKEFNYKKDFTKLSALNNILEYECNEMENKVLVFYYHPKTLEILKELYPKAFYISAEQSDNDRFQVINNFKSSKEKILFASILIANTSFTLTECKAEIFYERCWSGIIYEQARGRIHRIGQNNEVHYYNICYKNSIDNLQLLNLQTKGQCIENIGKKQVLSQKEWKTIFNGSQKEMQILI